jgi:hypothetical protein
MKPGTKPQPHKPLLHVDVERAESRSRPESLTPTGASMPTAFALPNTGLPSSVPAITERRKGYFEDEPQIVESPPLSPYESPTPKSAVRPSHFQGLADGGRTPTALRGQESPTKPKKPSLARTTTGKSSAHDTCLQVLP